MVDWDITTEFVQSFPHVTFCTMIYKLVATTLTSPDHEHRFRPERSSNRCCCCCC